MKQQILIHEIFSAMHVLDYQNRHVSVTSVNIFRVYSMNIMSAMEVMCEEILRDLVHCENSIKFRRSSS